MKTAAWLSILIVAACPFCAAGCGGPDEYATITFREFETDVVCGRDGTCVDDEGNEVGGMDVVSDGFMSGNASRFSPDGMYVFWSYERGGRYVEVELDVPVNVTGEVPSVTTLREYEGGREVFHTDASRGIVTIVRASRGDATAQGTFELMFTFFGPDGQEGTADDEVRFLRCGTFRLVQADATSQADYTYDEDYRGIWDIGIIIDIVVEDDAPSTTGTYDEAEGCEDDGYDESYEESEGGCEGDTYDDSGDDYDSACGGDSWGEESDGCESGGDTSGDTSGCEGDSSDSGGCDFDCEGDTYYSKRKDAPAGSTSWARMMPLLLPFLLRGILGSRRKRED